MGNVKKTSNKGTLSSDLLQRIDNMEENKDYNPYQSLRRTNIKDSELFNENDYEIKEDEDTILMDEDKARKDKRNGTIIALVVGAFVLSLFGGLIYIIYIGGLNI